MATDVRAAPATGRAPQSLAAQTERSKPSLRLTRGWCVLALLALPSSVDLLILGRMVILIIGASSGISGLVVELTDPLISPFLGDVSRHLGHNQAFEPELLIAVTFYGAMGVLGAFLLLIAGLVARLCGALVNVSQTTAPSDDEPRKPQDALRS
jgi:hypothetical protein